MNITEKIDFHLNEKVQPKELTKINNEITKNMKKLSLYIRKSDTYPDLKKSFNSQYNIVFDEWLTLFDIITDITQTME